MTKEQKKRMEEMIIQYKFPSFDTQQKLDKAGYFEQKTNFGIRIVRITSGHVQLYLGHVEDVLDIYENYLFPQAQEAIDRLPTVIFTELALCQKLELNISLKSVWYGCGNVRFYEVESKNICEAACLMWLKLKERGYIK